MTPYGSKTQGYRDAAVMTATPEQLVVMLYDGAIRFLRQAEHALAEGAYLHSHEKMGRAEAILDELIATLNMDAGEISIRLQSIYLFCKRALIEARMQKSPDKITEVIGLLDGLRDAWATLAAPVGTTAPASAA